MRPDDHAPEKQYMHLPVFKEEMERRGLKIPRLLFTVDSMIEQIWLQMDENLPMQVFLESLAEKDRIQARQT